MAYRDEIDEMFYRVDGNGNAQILYVEDGMPVTRMDENLYPVDSDLSVQYEHCDGIVLTIEEAENLGIEAE